MHSGRAGEIQKHQLIVATTIDWVVGQGWRSGFNSCSWKHCAILALCFQLPEVNLTLALPTARTEY